MAERKPIQEAMEAAYSELRDFKGKMEIARELTRYSAHGIGIGRKIVEGKPADQIALRIYVDKKKAKAHLSSAQMIPKDLNVISSKTGERVTLQTDVIEAPQAVLEDFDPEARHRPVEGGLSGGISGHTGTIGGWVWDETDDTIVMLSNDHVFGHVAGSDILQPGTADGGSLPADKIGDVKRGIARANPPGVNTVDCAIGDPDSDAIYALEVHDIGPAVYAIDVAEGDMLVEKYGQTTEHTYGIIEDVDWSGTVSGLLFDDCLYVEHTAPSADWSAGGDSGSLVFSRTPISDDSDIKPVVGLHFAGGGTHGIECKIQSVFDDLNLTTLCAGAFASFLDSLFEAEEEGEVSEETESRLLGLSTLAAGSARFVQPRAFIRKDLPKLSARRFHAGISRDIQAHMRQGKRGQILTDFVDQRRGELLTLLAKEGDVRRATMAAVRPLVAGATTSYDVLERKLTKQDVKRLNGLVEVVARKGSKDLGKRLKALRYMTRNAEGQSMAQILKLKL